MSASTRWLIGIGAVVVVAVVVSAVVALLATGAQEFPEGSPERAVQDYLAAVADDDADRAFSFLSSELTERCGTLPRDAITWRSATSFRAVLDDTRTRETGVEVRVRMTEFYGGGPFGRNESTWTVNFQLIDEDGAWRFSEAPWPLHCPPRQSTQAATVVLQGEPTWN